MGCCIGFLGAVAASGLWRLSDQPAELSRGESALAQQSNMNQASCKKYYDLNKILLRITYLSSLSSS